MKKSKKTARPQEMASNENAPWWEASLSRREANKIGVTMAALLGASSLGLACTKDPLEEIKEEDSLSLQKSEGWNVGDKNVSLSFANKVSLDSQGSDTWKEFVKDPNRLIEATRPAQNTWRAHESTSLFQSLSQESLQTQVSPVHSEEMQVIYDKGAAVASLVSQSENPEQTLLIVDLPGPKAVALAAGMSTKVDPVFYFDNWPHPKGTVKAHETLGATLYYAKELEENRKTRGAEKKPAAFVVNYNRLKEPKDPVSDFDNRYIVDPPTPEEAKALGIQKILYITEKEVKNEKDDLNDPFVAFEKQNIPVALLPMSAFGKASADTPAALANSLPTSDASSLPTSNATPPPEEDTKGYYYGHHPHHHTHFYAWYPMFIWFPGPRTSWRRSSIAPTRRFASKPGYKAKPRPTLFSNRTTGSTRGIGTRKPTGFGRVSTRVNASGQRVRATKTSGGFSGSAGKRSGSYGRSGGSGFGG